MERRLFTVEEAAEALALSRRKVYELARSGEPRSVKIGSSRRILAEALEEFIDGRLE